MAAVNQACEFCALYADLKRCHRNRNRDRGPAEKRLINRFSAALVDSSYLQGLGWKNGRTTYYGLGPRRRRIRLNFCPECGSRLSNKNNKNQYRKDS